MLDRVAAHLFEGEDPSQLFFRGRPQELTRQDGVYTLSLMLPFVQKGDVQLEQIGNELNVAVGAYRRNIVLPDSLAGLRPAGATMVDDRLNVRFGRVE